MNKPNEIKKLADLINNLTDENFNMSDDYPEDDYAYHYAKSSDTISEIEELANCCLIEKGGHPDFEAMCELKKLCPRINRIHRGDGDSFGWLTGVIVIDYDDKAIVYG
jgi:hypothetical protein